MHQPLSLFQLLDLRSFSNLWFWIVLAVTWSMASHWVLGVPYDMVLRARRMGGKAQQDLEEITRINVDRRLYIADRAGPWLVAALFFILSTCVFMGFWYDNEFSQAIFLLFTPLSLVWWLSMASARRIAAGEGQGDALHRRLYVHRFTTQVIGLAAIFVTALWGMYQNLRLAIFHH
ncbi:MAG: component of SufBCD complex [Paracoccaceae bacterium]|nr:component of SufBCD complex [Paracoccaceae bacterium]